MYDNLIAKVLEVNRVQDLSTSASSDPQGVKLAELLSPGKNLFGCQNKAVRDLVEILINRKLPTVIGPSPSSGPGQTDGYVGQLRVVVITGHGLAYPHGSTVLYIRPVKGGKGRGFRYESPPNVRQPIQTAHTRPATQSEIDALVEQIEDDPSTLTEWLMAGDWSLKSIARLSGGLTGTVRDE